MRKILSCFLLVCLLIGITTLPSEGINKETIMATNQEDNTITNEQTKEEKNSAIAEDIPGNKQSIKSSDTLDNQQVNTTQNKEESKQTNNSNVPLKTDDEKIDNNSPINQKQSQQIEDMKRKLLEDPKLKEIIDCLIHYQSFTSMPKDKQDLICDHYNIESETLLLCEQQGESLGNSVNLCVISNRHGFTLQEAQSLLKENGTMLELMKEMHRLQRFQEKNKPNEQNLNEIKELMLEGYKIKDLEKPFLVSKRIGLDLKSIVKKKDNSKVKELRKNNSNSEADSEKLNSLAEEYNLDADILCDYAASSNQTVAQVEAQLLSSLSSGVQPTVNYNRYFSAPFNHQINDYEKIDLSSGSLMYEDTVLDLPGRNGLDLNIMIRYDSSKANMMKPIYDIQINTYPVYQYSWEVYGGADMYWWHWGISTEWTYLDKIWDYKRLDEQTYREYDGVYNTLAEAQRDHDDWEDISLVWENAEPDTDYLIYYYADIYEIVSEMTVTDWNEVDSTSPDTFTELHNNLGTGWSLGFSAIESDGGIRYLHLNNGESYKINITSTVGDSNLEKYPRKDIRLESDSGSYSNGEMNSSYVLIYKDGKKEYFGADGRLLGIKDRYGNTIRFNHIMINGYPVISAITDTLNRVTNLVYETTSTGKKLTIIFPDSKTFECISESVPGYSSEYVLKQTKDQAGRITTYDYQYNSGNFTFFDKNNRQTSNTFANLKEIKYPTNASSNYTYQIATSNLGNLGSSQYYRLKTREERESNKIYNQETYNYDSNDFTGYPTYTDPNNLPSTFSYKNSIIDSNNTLTEITFDSKNLITTREVKENAAVLIKKDTYTYDANKLITNQTSSIYDKNEDGSAGSRTYDENWIYDPNGFGDLVQYTDALSHINSYTYDGTYHQLTNETKYFDPNKQIITDYTINPNTGNIDSVTKRHSENGTNRNIITSYTYDDYGNQLTSITQNGNETYIEENEYSSNYQNAYLTKKTLKLKSNANNEILDQKVVNQYSYDFSTGQVITSKDGKNHQTTYQYDNLGRIKKVINPDNTEVNIVYDDQQNIVTVTDENGHQKRNLYDGLGKLKKIQEFKNNTWVTILENSYNALNQVEWSKDARANQTQFQYDIFGRLVKKIDSNLKEYHIVYYDAENKITEIDQKGNCKRSSILEKFWPIIFHRTTVLV